MEKWQRTHTCGELREEHAEQIVVLNGWVNSYRAYNDQIFLDLRDRYGLSQVVIEANRSREMFKVAQEIRTEWVLSVRGRVCKRLESKFNPRLPTGCVELAADAIIVLNRCPTPPFEVFSVPLSGQVLGDPELAHEDLRLQYRYLDLRRPTLQRTLAMRHQVVKVIRENLDLQGFLDVETPMLGRSTPEGARDYLVPSRITPGSWYALPQSPQLYKQILMVAGFDKYYQIARCLRDEDLRSDRQPEFTQLDLEMSFVGANDVLSVVEKLTAEIFQRCLSVEINLPLLRLSYEDAMSTYGTDKPDLRFGLELVNVTDIATRTAFQTFRKAIATGGEVHAINAKGAAEKLARKQIDELADIVIQSGGKGCAWVKVEADRFTGGIEKFLDSPTQQQLRQRLDASPGDLLLFVADQRAVVCTALGSLRQHLGRLLNLYDPKALDFRVLWVVDFPAFNRDPDEGRWVANHHPFTAPLDEDIDKLESDPASVRAKAYDLVINGYECGGGSIRIHNLEVQARVFKLLGMSEEQARARFGFLLDALTYGAPPHGGVALGLDRWVMMLARTSNIRDVVAFPKSQKARDFLTGAPAPVSQKQLEELGLKIASYEQEMADHDGQGS
jgi:aspartyl-tRNA synthetase